MPSMYDEILAQKRAHTIIDLAQVQKGDKVLILCDYTTAELGQLLTSQAYNAGALPILTIIPVLKGHGDSAPMAVIELVDRDPEARGQDSGPTQDRDEDVTTGEPAAA